MPYFSSIIVIPCRILIHLLNLCVQNHRLTIVQLLISSLISMFLDFTLLVNKELVSGSGRVILNVEHA